MAGFKVKVALKAIRREPTVSQLAAKHGVDGTLIDAWTKQTVEGMARPLSGKTETMEGTPSVDTILRRGEEAAGQHVIAAVAGQRVADRVQHDAPGIAAAAPAQRRRPYSAGPAIGKFSLVSCRSMPHFG